MHPTSSKARRNHTLVISNVSIITSQSYIAKITFRLKLLFGLCLILTKWSCYWPMLFSVLSQNGHCPPFQGVSYWKVIIYYISEKWNSGTSKLFCLNKTFKGNSFKSDNNNNKHVMTTAKWLYLSVVITKSKNKKSL